jgi:hypothetical protein
MIYLPFNHLKWLIAGECIEFCTAASLFSILAWHCTPNFHLSFLRLNLSISIFCVTCLFGDGLSNHQSEHWPKTVTSSTRWDNKYAGMHSVLRYVPVCEFSPSGEVQVFWCFDAATSISASQCYQKLDIATAYCCDILTLMIFILDPCFEFSVWKYFSCKLCFEVNRIFMWYLENLCNTCHKSL